MSTTRTCFNTYPGSKDGWVAPKKKEIEFIFKRIKVNPEWKKPGDRGMEDGSNGTIAKHLGFTTSNIFHKRNSGMRISFSEWYLMCELAGYPIKIEFN